MICAGFQPGALFLLTQSCIYNYDLYLSDYEHRARSNRNILHCWATPNVGAVVTGHYNDAFVAEGVTFAQAGLLMHIFAKPGIRQAELSKLLQIEKSAMSRDVQLMQKRGWLTDNIRSGLFLTDDGWLLAKRCHKIWKVLNQQVYEKLGAEAINGLTIFSDTLLTKFL